MTTTAAAGALKIRITGTAQDCAATVAALTGVLELRDVSDFYPNRGTSVLGRVYLDAALTTATPTDAEHVDHEPSPAYPQKGDPR